MTVFPIKDRSSSPPTYSLRPSTYPSMFADDDETVPLSSICLRINTAVKVSSNSNVVCIQDTPAQHANAIARAVVNAIYENSSGQCGLPMIDEDGRPRPVKVEVDAGLEVLGADNVVGNECFIKHVLASRSRRKRVDTSDGDEEDERPETCSSKRRRSE